MGVGENGTRVWRICEGSEEKIKSEKVWILLRFKGKEGIMEE